MPELPNYVAIDVETDGLNVWRGNRPFSAGAVMRSGEEYYWRTDGVSLSPRDAPILARMLADPNLTKVFHNAKFDWRMLEWAGFTVAGPIQDTMIYGHLLDGRQELNLDALSKRYLPADMRKVTAEIEKWFDDNKYGKNIRYQSFGVLPPELNRKRNLGDARLTSELFKRTFATVNTVFPVLLAQETQLLRVVKAMEDRGICVDHEEIKTQKDFLGGIIDDVNEWAENMLGREYFNINARSDQMDLLDCAGLLKPLRALSADRKTPKGEVKLDDTNLRGLHHPIAHMLLVGKVAAKLRNTFLVGLETAAVDGIVHCQFNQCGTTTGRFSSNSPNLTNIPIEGDKRANYTQDDDDEVFDATNYRLGPHIKRCFVTRPGYAHVHSDKSRAELAMAAHHSHDRTLIKMLSDPHSDIHGELCNLIFGQTTKGLRTRTKRFVFGYLYGAGDNKLSKQVDATLSVTKSMRHKLNSIAPGLPALNRRLTGDLNDKGYIITDHGRRHYIDKSASYKAINSLCQGQVADEIKSRMVAIDAELTATYPDVRQLLCIHDDIATEVPIDLLPRIVPEIHQIMHETSVPYRLPLYSSMDITYDRWANLKEIKDINEFTHVTRN